MLVAQVGDQKAMDIAAWVTAATSAGGAGILVLVLRWLLWTHLPQKDEQLGKLLAAHDAERQKDREAQNAQAITYQEAISATVLANQTVLEKLEQKREEMIRSIQVEFSNRDAARRADVKEALKTMVDHWDRESSQRDHAFKAAIAEVATALRDVRLTLEDVKGVIRETSSRTAQALPHAVSTRGEEGRT